MYSISELVQLSKQDKRYMETLWIVLEKRCIKWAKKVQRVEGDWEDLYHEAYIVLTNVVEAYEMEKNINFEAYFMLALNNRARDYYRRQIPRKEYELKLEDNEEEKDWCSEVEDPNSNTEKEALEKVELMSMLEKLKDTDRYILETFYLKGQSREKIGHYLGLSCDAIDAKKRRALKKLKRISDGF
nr:sigma-70 family RNA polymerase sigma factor [uncultured Niameybacter sp.]